MSKVLKKGAYSYGIPRNRYYELRYFCLQHNEKKKSLGQIKENDPKYLSYIQDINLVESCVKESCKDLWEPILLSVTADLSYNKICPYCGERQFYEKKRAFFALLSERKRT